MFISLINFKKCIICLSNFGVLALEPRNKKKVGQHWETRMTPDIDSWRETFSMKQSLNFANILPSICNIYFWIAIFQLHYGNLPNVAWESARCSARKTLSGITKADLLKKLGPHLWFISKNASKDAVTLQFLTLNHSSYPYLSRLDYNRSR